ncbi:Glutathione synthetase [gamma proteobacterium HdN1]|nr:Glutathione synthetase [gamma proteobacterium HdN1]
MTLSIGVVMDPIQNIHYKKDSSLAMLWAAQARGWTLYYMEQQDLYLRDGEARATMRTLSVHHDPAQWWQFGDERDAALGSLDVILMRKDPPFNMEFVYTTYLLEAAERTGTLIVNRAASLRDCNEKLFATQFPACCPPTLVSASAVKLRQFAREQGDIVMKPLDGMGGSAVFRTHGSDENLSVIMEVLTQYGRTPIMAQRYLPEIRKGDKRILVVNGEPVPFCLARIPAEGEARGNLAAGGSGVVQPITERDRWLCAQVGSTLREKGLLFVGLDVIGDYLTEINVTSPTCIREIDAAAGTDIAEMLMNAIASAVRETQ